MTLAKSGLALQLLVLTGAANCHPAPHQTPAPELRFLYHLNSSLGEPVSFGPGPSGTKMSIPILGGTVEGPNICGTFCHIDFRILAIQHTDCIHYHQAKL